MTTIYDTSLSSKISEIELQACWANVWVNANLDGTSDTSYGVSSLTDTGTGKIGVSFSTIFTTTTYIALATPQKTTVVNTCIQSSTNLSTSRSDFECTEGVDPNEWNITCRGHT